MTRLCEETTTVTREGLSWHIQESRQSSEVKWWLREVDDLLGANTRWHFNGNNGLAHKQTSAHVLYVVLFMDSRHVDTTARVVCLYKEHKHKNRHKVTQSHTTPGSNYWHMGYIQSTQYAANAPDLFHYECWCALLFPPDILSLSLEEHPRLMRCHFKNYRPPGVC